MKKLVTINAAVATLVAACVALTGCGGGTSGQPTYTLSGTLANGTLGEDYIIKYGTEEGNPCIPNVAATATATTNTSSFSLNIHPSEIAQNAYVIILDQNGVEYYASPLSTAQVQANTNLGTITITTPYYGCGTPAAKGN